MKKFPIVTLLLTVLGGLAALIIGVIMMLLSYANTATTYEVNIKKFNLNTQNVLSAYTMKIKDMAQIPEAYVQDLRNVIQDTFQGRYGEDGSRAAFQWIQEQNHQLDVSVYKEIQLAMRSGRDEFKLSQDRKLEICADYEVLYSKPVSKMILGLMGYPSQDIDNLCKIVLDVQTNKAFETGLTETIKIR